MGALRDMRGPLARDISRVVEEAINNAITHGEASRIAVDASGGEGFVVVDVTDDGLGPQGDAPGLGSALFDSLCRYWELTAAPQGSRCHCRLAW